MSNTTQSQAISDSIPPSGAVSQLPHRSAGEASSELPGADIWLHTPQVTKHVVTRQFIWLMTVISLGLHGLFLLIPIPAEPDVKSAEPEDARVRITQMPSPTRSVPSATPKASPTPQPSPPPQRPVAQPTTTVAIPQPSAAPSTPAPPQETPQPQASASPPPEAPANGGNPWQDFPVYPGAQPGCYNLPSCLQTNATLEDVSNYFERELTAKHYTVQPDTQESDRHVYQISRNGLTQFLTLFFVNGKTVYVLSEAPRTLADLGQAIEVPTALYDVLANFAAEDATRADFAQPDLFYLSDTLKPPIAVAQVVTGEAPDTFFDTYLRTNLFNNGFSSSETPQPASGGLLYTITKDDLTLYINLVPNQDGSGTIVVIWREPPE